MFFFSFFSDQVEQCSNYHLFDLPEDGSKLKLTTLPLFCLLNIFTVKMSIATIKEKCSNLKKMFFTFLVGVKSLECEHIFKLHC